MGKVYNLIKELFYIKTNLTRKQFDYKFECKKKIIKKRNFLFFFLNLPFNKNIPELLCESSIKKSE